MKTVLVFVLVACACHASRTDQDAATLDGGVEHDVPFVDGPFEAGTLGSPCDCDVDCFATGDHRGVCYHGVCLAHPHVSCAGEGTREECPDHSRCWRGTHGVSLCWPDCDAFPCAGSCDSTGTCAPDDTTGCNRACSNFCDLSCRPGGTLCLRSESCCIGQCTAPLFSEGEFRCCVRAGSEATCYTDDDCCTGACVDGRCCLANGEMCSGVGDANAECCSGTCSDRLCVE